jgi:hypothetical protein
MRHARGSGRVEAAHVLRDHQAREGRNAMTERRPEGAASPTPAGSDPPVPRDPQDQQIQEDEDPLDVPVPQRVKKSAARDVPDTDESGTGRAQGEPADSESEQPTPDESPG